MTPDRGATAVLTATTVEELVREQLSTALGGRRGLIEGALPTLAFTVTFVLTHQLKLSLGLGLGLAAAVLLARILARSTVQFAVNSLVGIGIAAVVASRTGRAADVFLPGMIWNAAVGLIIVVTNLVRWPLVGLVLAGATGDFTWWRRDPAVLGLCTKLTWLFVIPNVIRLAVQVPLYLAGKVGWLGATKLALGWPLYLAVLAVMGWVLAKGHTPLPASFAALPADRDPRDPASPLPDP